MVLGYESGLGDMVGAGRGVSSVDVLERVGRIAVPRDGPVNVVGGAEVVPVLDGVPIRAARSAREDRLPLGEIAVPIIMWSFVKPASFSVPLLRTRVSYRRAGLPSGKATFRKSLSEGSTTLTPTELKTKSAAVSVIFVVQVKVVDVVL